jgi:DNA-directed RNA polymerase specialized sigma24 family protein
LRRQPITREGFEQLLCWLDPERGRAGEKYENIRRRLIQLFSLRGCTDAEELADETINRVIMKLPDIAANYEGDPAAYFHAVARYVYLEHAKAASRLKDGLASPRFDSEPHPAFPQDNDERLFGALDRCLDKLRAKDRELILDYYGESRDRITRHKELAGGLDITTALLRKRAQRIRQALKACIDEELDKSRE